MYCGYHSWIIPYYSFTRDFCCHFDCIASGKMRRVCEHHEKLAWCNPKKDTRECGILDSMKQPIFVHPLTEEEHKQLEAGLRSSDAFVLRRAQILLTSSR